ncbi:MAG TPA: hypothetical protein VHL10_00210 [Nitrososphaera sp.]|jgi:hypothetical protein|nr:hypothetical protein [Nitrososphaera sp.]
MSEKHKFASTQELIAPKTLQELCDQSLEITNESAELLIAVYDGEEIQADRFLKYISSVAMNMEQALIALAAAYEDLGRNTEVSFTMPKKVQELMDLQDDQPVSKSN